MNSKSKFHENQQENNSSQETGSCSISIMQAKIKNQIKGYQMRKLSSQDEYSDIKRCLAFNDVGCQEQSKMRIRLNDLLNEIDFCKKQIIAYQTNDNKAKIIPDRLL